MIDCVTGAELARLTPPEGRQFNGHGAFSADGTRLYTSEVVAEGSAGRVGVWDVRAGYQRIGEWDSRGIGPHELRLLPDGNLAFAASLASSGAHGGDFVYRTPNTMALPSTGYQV